MQLNQTIRLSALALLLAGSLSACVPTLIGTAVVGGAVSGVDRRTTGAQADDEVMELRVKNSALSAIKNNSQVRNFSPEISVVSYNRHILLMGQVANEEDKQLAERVARAEHSAEKVYNYIHVVGTGRTLKDISSDTWITSKVRANLLNVQGVYPGYVKVVTYAGTTYVMGLLTPAQQAAVTEAVRTSTGVQQVVTLYQDYQ